MNKALAFGLLLALTSPVLTFAADDAAGFETRKAEALKEIDQHIAKMNEHRTCVSAAKDKEAMKACHEAMKDFHHDKRMEMMEHRHDRMGKKIDKMKSH